VYRVLLIFIFLFSSSAFAYVDLNLQYSFTKRRIEGVGPVGSTEDPGEAITNTTGYYVNWAWYMWEYTALELNYSSSQEQLIDTRITATTDETVKIQKIDSVVITNVQGAGIRQSFASRKSTIIPSLSIGYAKMTTSGTTKYLLDVSGTEQSISLERDKETYNSSYATFQIRIQFTQLMGFVIAAKTVMPDFDTKQAQNNLTYTAGFSWIF
jgi:hypothetical protein